MIGKVLDFKDKKWRVYAIDKIHYLEDWQCQTGMKPSATVELRYKKGYWHAYTCKAAT